MVGDIQRQKALHRALKWTKLFQEKYFDYLLPEIYNNNKNAFLAVFTTVANDDTTTEEKEWLWNYLQHCGPDVVGSKWKEKNVREAAAGTGW